MGLGIFKMDTAKINESGAKFQEYSEEYRNLMTQLRTTVEDLGACWKAEDYQAFLAIYEKNAESIDQMSKAFASFGEILSTVSKNVDKASANLRADMK